MKHTTRMRFTAWAAFAACLVILSPAAQGQAGKSATDTAAIMTKARALFASLDQNIKTKNADGFQGLFDPDFFKAISESTKMAAKDIAKNIVEKKDWTEFKSTLMGVEPHGEVTVARVERAEKWRTKEGKEESRLQKQVFFLKDLGGQLKILNFSEDMDKEEFDTATHVYQSTKGHYTIQVPENWLPIKNSPGLVLPVPEAVVLVAPDMKSSVILGFIQLPIMVEPKVAVQADMAIEKQATQEHKLLDQADMNVGNFKGYRLVTEFKYGQHSVKRMRVYFESKPMLYFFICSAEPAGQDDSLKADFNRIVNSFKIVPPPGGQTVQEAVAGQLAQGGISGQNYTNKDFNCFISAPAGWTIQTSPNPAHLVEMHPAQGKSLARLIAAKGLKPGDTAKTAFEGRLGAMKGLLKDFKEISRRDVTIQGCSGIESIQTFTLEPLGKFSAKEVTLVRNGTYYLILCQAVEPDEYKALEPDFDRIIQSFGFIQ